METTDRPAQMARFLPDWLVGGVIRLALAPMLWMWGRAHAGTWPDVMPDIIHAASVWNLPFIAPAHLAQIAVWGSQIAAALLVLGVLTRLVGFILLMAAWIYGVWVAPEAWPLTVMFAASSFYLFARGGGGFSIDGAVVATTR
ncbi:TQO small subunit DoxD [Maricaulis parjimensis]|uniref:TQO small subunit DoxD n=1 Tax=Maricaulis parjimensis TaxID=144023 RepID=UPI00193A0ACD|nr:TQO small subunit DoxD [Maricaulis parjimensis]